MTRKHFKTIAQLMYDTKPDEHADLNGYFTWISIVNKMCYEFRQINPNFDNKKFYNFCKEGK